MSRIAAIVIAVAIGVLGVSLGQAQPQRSPGAGASASGSASSASSSSASSSSSVKRPLTFGSFTRPPGGFAPDPPPLVTARKWRYEIIFHEGGIFIPTPVLVERARPSETPRGTGRFLLEIYVGPTLLDRVRFDIPLLNGDVFDGEKRPFGAPPGFERKLHAKTSVEMPDSDRATFALLTDRATGRRIRAPWPRVDGPFPQAATAASSSPAVSPSAAPATSAR